MTYTGFVLLNTEKFAFLFFCSNIKGSPSHFNGWLLAVHLGFVWKVKKSALLKVQQVGCYFCFENEMCKVSPKPKSDQLFFNDHGTVLKILQSFISALNNNFNSFK